MDIKELLIYPSKESVCTALNVLNIAYIDDNENIRITIKQIDDIKKLISICKDFNIDIYHRGGNKLITEKHIKALNEYDCYKPDITIWFYTKFNQYTLWT